MLVRQTFFLQGLVEYCLTVKVEEGSTEAKFLQMGLASYVSL